MIVSKSWSKRNWRIAIALVSAVLAPIPFLWNSIGVGAVGSSAPQVTSGSIAGYAVTYPISLPSGYETIAGLYAAPSRSGVWVVASASQSQALFFWSTSTGRLTTYPIDTSNSNLGVGAFAPIVQDASGIVYVGLNRTILRLDPSTGVQSTFTLPPISVGKVGSGLPQYPGPSGEFNPIDSLVIDTEGNLVVGRMFATALQVVDPSLSQLTSIALPTGTSLAGIGQSDIAVDSSSGGIAAVLYSVGDGTQIGQYTGNTWYVNSLGCPTYAVSYSDGKLVASGGNCLSSGLGAAANRAELLKSVYSGALVPNPGALELSNSTLIASSSTGALLINGAGASSILSLGSITSGPSSDPSGLPLSFGNTSQSIRPTLFSSGSPGQVWFIPQQSDPVVGLILY